MLSLASLVPFGEIKKLVGKFTKRWEVLLVGEQLAPGTAGFPCRGGRFGCAVI